jgi:hypothetical protein
MLRLIRWLFASAVLAWLFALAVAFRIHGHTVAEVGCKLAGSQRCETWAQRCGVQVRRTLELFGYPESKPSTPAHPERAGPHDANPPREPARTPAPTASNARPQEPVIVAPTDGPPLDQHTPQDRRALDKILTNHGSR